MSRFMNTAISIYLREVLRFGRQRARILGAFGMPLLFWGFMGAGFGRSFQAPGMAPGVDYLSFFFPGMVVGVVLFTAIFGAMSVIEDRNEGFLQGVMTAPVPRSAIVLGKILGVSTIGLFQGSLLMVLAPLVGVELHVSQWPLLLLILLLSAIALSGTGFFFAWRMNSVQGFHAIMNLLLMPMWLLSGAFFPAQGAAGWMRTVMMFNPLTYALESFRPAFAGQESSSQLVPGVPPLLLLTAFAVIIFMAAVLQANRQEG